ncbi:hypothetical protein [Mucilaginibacter antarcticus]|uniref:hypothetical protein n=1 Tax=Mucilaginibacter antarcticus TaxID=1855725 RepID=UPI00362F721D
MAFMAGCNPQPVVNAIQVKYADNHAVTITGIDAAILNDIDRDSVKNWQSLLAIYRMPADTDMKDYQPIQPGKYLVKDGGWFLRRIQHLQHNRYILHASIIIVVTKPCGNT